MSYKLLSAILKSNWFIQPDYVESHMPIIANILSKSDITASVPKDQKLVEDENVQPYAVVGGRAVSLQGSLRKGVDYSTVPHGSIAVIPVKGPLMKEDEDDCGYFTAGTATLAKRIQEADEHKNISGTILHFDTPGGTIDGIQAFADAIKATKKPIVAFVDGLCASAGVFASSSCDYLVAQDITAQIGSIGVMMSFVDTQPYYEKLGLKFHAIYSKLSPDKNRSFREAREGNYDLIQKESLDPYAEIFRNQVKSNRPNVQVESMTGMMYMAEEALRRGLIDEIGTIDMAAKKVVELANAVAEASTNNLTKTEMKQFASINALLGIASLESTDEGSYMNEEHLQLIEDRLTAAAKADQDLATANENLIKVKADLDTANAGIIDLNSRIADLASGPADKPASVKSDNNALNDGEEDFNAICEKNDTATSVDLLRKAGF